MPETTGREQKNERYARTRPGSNRDDCFILGVPNKMVKAANGVDYALRELGGGAVPLVLLQHFRGNLDYWDPALIDALTPSRRAILFDNLSPAVPPRPPRPP